MKHEPGVDQFDQAKKKMTTSVSLPCSFPTDPVHIFLFTEVLNALELRSRLLAGDTEYLYAFLDADLVLSPLFYTANGDLESTSTPRRRQSSSA